MSLDDLKCSYIEKLQKLTVSELLECLADICVALKLCIDDETISLSDV